MEAINNNNGKHPGGRPLKYKPDYMDSKLTEYINDCEVNKKPVTITGYCQWIGSNRETLSEYADRDEFVDTIKRLKGAAENCLVDVMLSGKNPAGAIFLAKNHFNYTDKIEQTSTNVNLFVAGTAEDAAALLSGMAGYLAARETNTKAINSPVVDAEYTVKQE